MPIKPQKPKKKHKEQNRPQNRLSEIRFTGIPSIMPIKTQIKTIKKGKTDPLRRDRRFRSCRGNDLYYFGHFAEFGDFAVAGHDLYYFGHFGLFAEFNEFGRAGVMTLN